MRKMSVSQMEYRAYWEMGFKIKDGLGTLNVKITGE